MLVIQVRHVCSSLSQKRCASTRSSITSVWSRSAPSGTSTGSHWRGNWGSWDAVSQRVKRRRTWRMRWKRLTSSTLSKLSAVCEVLILLAIVQLINTQEMYLNVLWECIIRVCSCSNTCTRFWWEHVKKTFWRRRRMRRSCVRWWCPWSRRSPPWKPNWPQLRTEWRNWRPPRLVGAKWVFQLRR